MNIITKLNIRQKIMLGLTLLAAIFLVWQIYTFVHNDAAPGSESSSSSKSAAAGKKPLPGPDANATPSKVIHELPSAENTNPALVVQQRQYLELVRQYQITKMRRQILEEQAAVANAQKRITDAGKGHDYGNLDSLVSAGGLIAGYQLSYVDRQAGQWSATVSENGQYREVHVGSRLADGSRVVSIHSDKVVLRHRQGQKWELTFPGSPNVDENAVTPSTKKSINNRIKTNIPAQSQIKPSQSNAKIAKILGITSTPGQSASSPVATAPALEVTPAAPTLPPPISTVPPQLKSNKPATTDIPAAPLTITPPVITPPVMNANPEAVTESNPSVQAPTPVTTEPPVVNDASVVNTAPSANVEDVTLLPDNEMTAEATLPAPSTTGKPVSVKELREHNATQNASAISAPVALETSYEDFNKKAAELNQISLQQAADLQAAVLNDQ